MPVLAGAEPFSHTGSPDVGVLLCHGFTGSPASMRPWGEHLAEAGYTVRGPRLPGHGTTWREMNRTGWTDWYACVEAEFGELARDCESVFVFGLSMGGTLALRLAEQHGDAVAGLALVNPSVLTLRRDARLLPLLARFVPSVKGVAGDIAKPGVTELAYGRTPVRAAASLAQLWKLVRADLHKVTQPLLLLHSVVDHVVEPVNSRIIAEGVRSTDLTEVLLHDSYHVATLDNDAPLIFERSVEFVRSVRQVGAR
ncbi:alpha/beta hydrolase [Prauserella muralis]|uniref:Esterase n=1 Tax=Prauserella muralis TaxID=588067 RepID=A0A2V4B396_9PSEU|nr:alpha/beta fold hydrolase [Prauserella muralis]PXY28462.1 esterase [Prauserella muralis]TWE22158.1 carboxylesterase [Prauserella muralis]